MVNSTENSIKESRFNVRVGDNRWVSWSLSNNNLKGKGKVRNISLSGMMLEANAAFEPRHDDQVSFDNDLAGDNYIPSTGRVVWQKRKNGNPNQYLLGVKFDQPTEHVSTKLYQKIESIKTRNVSKKRTEKILSGIIIIAMVCLTAFVVWMSTDIYKGMDNSNKKLLDVSGQQSILTQTYANLYHVTELKLISVTEELNATKQLYADSQTQLDTVSKELETTKAILSQTEALLAQATGSTPNLQLDQAQIAATKANLESTIESLESQNQQLNSELESLQERLDYYAGNIKNLTEGKKLLTMYHERIRVVKSRINAFKRQAQEVRIAAQKERDRVRSALGNNGYFVRNGEVVKVDADLYQNAGKQSQLLEEVSPEKRNIRVDVNFTD